MATTDPVTLTKDGTTITIYVENFQEDLQKTIRPLTFPQSTANKELGPKTTKILDLQRVVERYTFTGYVALADKVPLKNMVKAGGVFTLAIPCDSESGISVNCDKLNFTKDGRYEQDERGVVITLIVGADL